MRWWCVILVVLAGCGSSKARPRVTAVPVPSATPAGPWSAPVAGKRTPIACPASSSRAGWASRIRSVGGGRFVKTNPEHPRLFTVSRDGSVLRRQSVGAPRFGYMHEVGLACGRGGRLAVAWVERHGPDLKPREILRVRIGGTTRTIDSVRNDGCCYDLVSSVALAYARDGTLLVVYAVPTEVRATTVSPSGSVAPPVRLGPALGATSVVTEIAPSGRAVVSWTTIDAHNEHTRRRRIYAVTGRPGALGPPRLVQRVGHLNPGGTTEPSIALALAPNGRALLTYGADRPADPGEEQLDAMEVRISEALPAGGFRASRRVSRTGGSGWNGRADAAIRSDGTKLVVFRTLDDGLRAFYGKRLEREEVVTRGERDRYPTASFTRAGRARVEWQAGASTRATGA